MIRLYALVEGQTEETFINALLMEHLIQRNVLIQPIRFSTSQSQKGGITTYGKIKKQICCKCLEDKKSFVTTMIDYYRRPTDFPGSRNIANTDPLEMVKYLELEFSKDISYGNFIPNIVLHEFEGLLYSQPSTFENWFDDKKAIAKVVKERESFDTPEHINQGADSAPSKRICKHFPGYNKVLHGTRIALEIGLDVIRKECAHFNAWVNRLEKLGSKS